ncbi:MAG: hypothetical protein ACYTE6_10400 [Planctomycetota bacterium]|jgi:hypothetical protein
MRTSLHTLVVAGTLAACLAPMAQAGNTFVNLRSRLFGDGKVFGQAVYQERDHGVKGLERRFKVMVKGAEPGETLNVRVEHYFVATLRADVFGRARLSLRTEEFIDDPHTDEPMPEDFPELQSRDFVMAGVLSGILFDGSRGAAARAQRYRLQGELEGDPEVGGDVWYLERFKNGRLLRRFKVEVEDAEPGQVFDVFVNGMFVGEVVINDDDEGELELRTPAFIHDPDDGLPMPGSFPSLLPGDIVEVGPLSTILTRR